MRVHRYTGYECQQNATHHYYGWSGKHEGSRTSSRLMVLDVVYMSHPAPSCLARLEGSLTSHRLHPLGQRVCEAYAPDFKAVGRT